MWIADWRTEAACKGGDPDQLFVQGAAQNRAKLACRGCPVRPECLAEALDDGVEFGVWGGMTERERRALLRRRPEVLSWLTILWLARQQYEGTFGKVSADQEIPGLTAEAGHALELIFDAATHEGAWIGGNASALTSLVAGHGTFTDWDDAFSADILGRLSAAELIKQFAAIPAKGKKAGRTASIQVMPTGFLFVWSVRPDQAAPAEEVEAVAT